MNKFWRALFSPIPIWLLVYFRLAFGSIMLWEVWRYFHYGWIKEYYIDPTFFFKYYGFGWVQPWSGDGMYWHFYGLGVLSIFIIVGFCYRLSTFLFFLSFSYVFLLDQARYLNHFYFVSLMSFLLSVIPAHRAFSIDVLLWKRLRSQAVPFWSLLILRLQISIVYFYAGLAKLNHDWLAGEPMRMWLADRTYVPILGKYFTEEWMVYLFSYGGMLFDLLVVPLLLWQRTRWLGLLWAVSFHMLNRELFNIGIFPWFALAGTVLFLSPNLLPRFSPPNNEPPIRWGQKVLIGILSVYFAFQLLFPLRHHLYPSNVHWSEEGHRFSWRMKLRSKDATELRITVRDGQTGTSWEVKPEDYLTDDQIDEMESRPDMLLQFAHYLRDLLEEDEEGFEAIEITMVVMVSLNGRPPQLLLDPTVNLAEQKRSLAHADWILPLTTPLQKP